MRVGMLARAENRGLGTMCWEWHRHMQPDKTLVVIPDGVRHANLTSHLERFPGATTVRYDGTLDPVRCADFLDGLDVVYTAETFYDWRFVSWARNRGVATVCHVMPEWWSRDWEANPPTEWWAPTTWRMRELPRGTRHVPVPIAADRFSPQEPRGESEFRWLHVAGAQTHADRNGTKSVLNAARFIKAPQEVVVRSQTTPYSTSARVTLDHRDLENYWDGYAGYDALLMPRRYAGLCLPVLEAFAAGLPVMMSDMPPQRDDWPVRCVPTAPGKEVRIMRNRIPTGDVNSMVLARMMDSWVSNPGEVESWRDRARLYAEEHSWALQAPQMRARLEEVVDRVAS